MRDDELKLSHRFYFPNRDPRDGWIVAYADVEACTEPGGIIAKTLGERLIPLKPQGLHFVRLRTFGRPVKEPESGQFDRIYKSKPLRSATACMLWLRSQGNKPLAGISKP